MQQREFQRRLARGFLRHEGFEQRLRLRVLAARDRELGKDGDGGLIGRSAPPRDFLRVVALAMCKRRRRTACRIHLHRLGTAHGRAR
jgi:hypothetical protein